jgi:hypothetical protein
VLTELADARRTLKVLTWALALMPGGCLESTAMLRGGIDQQLRRLDRAAREHLNSRPACLAIWGSITQERTAWRCACVPASSLPTSFE